MQATKNSKPVGSITTKISLSGQTFDPDLFSEIACAKPTKIWYQQNALLKNDPKFAQIEWRYELRKSPHWSIDDAIQEILDLFEPRRNEIVAFAKKHNCHLHLSCRIFGDETVVIYQIERPTIERLAAFGCELSFTVESALTITEK